MVFLNNIVLLRENLQKVNSRLLDEWRLVALENKGIGIEN